MSRPTLYTLNKPRTDPKKPTDTDDVRPAYTSAYKDNAGFGMVMSVSKSVFEKNSATSSQKKYKVIKLFVRGVNHSKKAVRDFFDFFEFFR